MIDVQYHQYIVKVFMNIFTFCHIINVQMRTKASGKPQDLTICCAKIYVKTVKHASLFRGIG